METYLSAVLFLLDSLSLSFLPGEVFSGRIAPMIMDQESHSSESSLSTATWLDQQPKEGALVQSKTVVSSRIRIHDPHNSSPKEDHGTNRRGIVDGFWDNSIARFGSDSTDGFQDGPSFLDLIHGAKPYLDGFETIHALMNKDPECPLSRVKKSLSTSSHTIIVGGGGTGKSENILQALQDLKYSSTTVWYDLRADFFQSKGWPDPNQNSRDRTFQEQLRESKKIYMSGKSKTEQIEWLRKVDLEEHEDEEEDLEKKPSKLEAIRDVVNSKLHVGDIVLVLDEVDLSISRGDLNQDELDALFFVVQAANTIQKEHTNVKILMTLHTGPAKQVDLQEKLTELGYPQPSDAQWIDLDQLTLSDAIKTAIMQALLGDCLKKLQDESLMKSVMGMPSRFWNKVFQGIFSEVQNLLKQHDGCSSAEGMLSSIISRNKV